MQQAYIAALTDQIERDGRIKVAWLEGSFGRGTADRYSDLDIHLLLDEAALAPFRAQIQSWLSALRPLVLFKLMFNDRMINALTEDGLRLDIWLHAGSSIALDRAKAQVLFQTDDAIRFEAATDGRDPPAVAQALLGQTQEFWRCISLLPSVIGRNELIIGLVGLTVEVNLLTEVLINGYEIARDSGVKRLNPFLPLDVQQAIESAVSTPGLSQASLAQAHLGLATIMREHGRIIASKHGYAYPQELEAAVIRYVQQELDLLSLDARFD